jgi:DNA-binding NarL/FixJ family response regulator
MTEAAKAPRDEPTPVLRLVEPARPVPLTPRERDVLRHIAEGLSTREVAREMCYSERTIKNVLQSLTARLQFRNRTQAVACAVRNGWI